jgi:outer membrane receptor for ferrienterochelin and colicin
MKMRTKAVWSLAVALCFALVMLTTAVPAGAQTVTTGNITGTVTDAQGGVLPGATVTAVHTDTGTNYEAVTGADGRYSILNVRVGPYTITAAMSGFRNQKQDKIQIQLGAEQTADFKLALSSVSETVEVVASTPLIDLARAGTADNISNAVKESLPTISRSIADIVRISPMFNSQGGSGGDGASVVSVAGNSPRYNGLQIDGAANNDLFGLASSAGAPGGTAETQPISLDAIQEIQLVVSPYDVRQGGFTGGGINAVTKSGTNSLHGTGFFFGRNQNWVGKGPTNRKISTLKDKQGGGSLGGPVVKNRAFFFGTADYGRKERPTGFSVNQGGQQFGNVALVDQFVNDLKTLYGYTIPGDPKAEFTKVTNSDKYFVRGDVNVARGHQLTVRHNYIDAFNDISSTSLTTYRLSDAYYRYFSTTNSSVAQLNSQFGKGVNEFRLTLTRVRDHRGNPVNAAPFPAVTVTLAPSANVIAGTENFSGKNAIDQDIIELNDAYTVMKGRHTFTLGTHNEFLDLKNLFIRDSLGSYNFSSLANFETGFAQQYDRSFSATSDPDQRAAFKVRQLGFYAGDQWRMRSNVTLTYGLRIDAPTFPDKPNANPLALSTFGFATDVVPSQVQFTPRAGFNWDLTGNGTQQIRGGVGLFSGRPAYVWLSNQYGNTGIDFTRIGAGFNANNRIPFVANPAGQPAVVIGATAGSFTNEIDMIDPDFKYPSVLRGNLGYDRQLWGGFTGNFDFVFSKTVNDIAYENLNLVVAPGVTSVGGRPFFVKPVAALSNVILLKNTDQGYTWNAAAEVRRPFTNGAYINGSYSYGRAKSVMDGTSDQAASNWANVYNPGDPNHVPVARSNFDPGHRITLTATYEVPFVRVIKPRMSVFYSGSSGRPYTLTYGRDVNGDAVGGATGGGFNDLLYIPTATDAFTYTGGTYGDLLGYLNGDPCLTKYIGKIIPRNACRAPWQNTLDGRFAVELPYKRYKTEITLDALNLINLFDAKSGQFQYLSFGQSTLIQPVPTTITTTAPVTGYNITPLTNVNFQRWLRDDLRSRWQIQLGARVRF